MNYKSLITYLFFCCSFSTLASVTIIEVKHTDEICDLANGTITIIAQSAAPILYYSIDNGASYQNSNFFDGLESKDYLIRVSDGFSCTEIYTVQITDINTPEISLSVVCQNGTGNVDIDLIPFQSGKLPFTYSWLGPNGTYDTEDLTGVPPGDYSVTLSDFDGCSVDTSFNVPVCCYLDVACSQDTNYYTCLAEYEDLSQTAFDTLLTNDAKLNFLKEALAIHVTGDPCNEISVVVTKAESQPMDCSEPKKNTLSIEISDSVSIHTCTKTYFIANHSGFSLDCPGDLNLLDTDDVFTEIGNWLNTPTVVDNCSIVTVSDNYDVANFNADCNGRSLPVEFLATDECGNTAQCTAIIAISGSGSPTITCPTDLMIECNTVAVNTAINTWLLSAEGLDFNTSPIPVSNDLDVSTATLSCGSELIVTFSVATTCGATSCTSKILSDDTIGPEVTCPPDLIFSFDVPNPDQLISDWLIGFTTTDNCAVALEAHDYDPSKLIIDCQGTSLPVAYNAKDACENTSNCIANINVLGGQGGTISCPAPLEVNCDQLDIPSLIETWTQSAIAIDEQGVDLLVANDLEQAFLQDLTCRVLEVGFDATGNCIDLACKTTISIIDNELPKIACPADIDLDVTATNFDLDLANWLAEVNGTDNCSVASVDHDLVVDTDLDCGETIEVSVQYIVTDHCNNTAECNSTLTLTSPEALPGIVCPENLIVHCGEDTNMEVLAWIEEAVVESSAVDPGTVENDFIFSKLENIECGGILAVVFEVSNGCGINDCVSTITYLDEDAPVIICESFKEVVIADSLDVAEIEAWLSSVEAIDNCGAAAVEADFNFDLSKVLCSEDVAVEFRARDACDNIASCQTTLTISKENILLLDCPESMTMDCKEFNKDSIDYQILMELSVSSDIPYELEYNYEIAAEDIGCDYVYNYSVSVAVIDTCLNEIDCMIDMEITPEPLVYIPNVFSPDVTNQRRFTIYANPVIESVEEFYIYDKWGELVHEAYEFYPNEEESGWNGRYDNDKDDGGVYVYYAVLRSVTGEKYSYTGDVTLLR